MASTPGAGMARRASLAVLDGGHVQARRKLIEGWAEQPGDSDPKLRTKIRQDDEADAKALAAKMREKLAARQPAPSSRLQPLPRRSSYPEPEPEPERTSLASTNQSTEDALRQQRILAQQHKARAEAAEAAQKKEAESRKKEALRREALAAYEERITALAESQPTDAGGHDTPSLAPVAKGQNPSAPTRPLRSREESRKALQTAQAALDAIIDESQWMSPKLAGHTLPVLAREPSIRSDGTQAQARVLAAEVAAAEAEDWRVLVAETDCRAMARRTAPQPAWISGSQPAEPNPSLYATAEYSILERQYGATSGFASASVHHDEASTQRQRAPSASEVGEVHHRSGRAGYAHAVLQQLVELERTGQLQPTGLLEEWGATTIQRSFRTNVLSPRSLERATASWHRLVIRAVRSSARAHAVRVRDAHEGALACQRELRRNLPRDSEDHSTGRGLHRHRHQKAEAAVSGAIDPSASIQLQALQKLLADTLKEVAVATDPLHRRIAEEMLAQVRAEILAQRNAEWIEGNEEEEFDGDSEWDETAAVLLATARQTEDDDDEEEDEDDDDEEELSTLSRQYHRDTNGARTLVDSRTWEQMDSSAGAMESSTMDSWLAVQQHQALQLRQATERPPLSKSQGNHASTELRRGGTMRPTPARWKPTVGRQQQHQQAPPNDALREKLAVRSTVAACCPNIGARFFFCCCRMSRRLTVSHLAACASSHRGNRARARKTAQTGRART